MESRTTTQIGMEMGVVQHLERTNLSWDSTLSASGDKDEKYYERRRRNNLAAKKSRDARKLREDEIAVRVNDLEQENGTLRAQVAILREESTILQLYLMQKQKLSSNIHYKSSLHN